MQIPSLVPRPTMTQAFIACSINTTTGVVVFILSDKRLRHGGSGYETTIDPLVRWKMHDGQFPPIANLASKYLAIPASSAPSERVFSR